MHASAERNPKIGQDVWDTFPSPSNCQRKRSAIALQKPQFAGRMGAWPRQGVP